MDVKAYRAKRLVVRTESNMRILTADEHSVALLNLAVPSPIFRETEPILVLLLLQWQLRDKRGRGRVWTLERASEICGVEQVSE